MIGFGAPLLLLGLLAVAVPIAIHLQDRRRARPLKFAAIDFVLRSRKSLTRFVRIRQWLLLALRAGAVAALALALARPEWKAGRPEAEAAGPATTRLILLDDSPAASARWEGRSAWRETADRGREILREAGPADQVVVARLSAVEALRGLDFAADAREALEAAEAAGPSARRVDGFAALTRAVALLREGGLGARTVHVVSRFPRGTWRVESWRPERAADAARPVTILWEPVGAEAPLPNLALGALRATQAFDDAGRASLEVTATVTNFGVEDAARASVALRLEGEDDARGFVDVPAGGAAEATFTLAPEGPGPYALTARLGADALALDDVCSLAFEPRARLRTLIVDGDPQPTALDRESYFLELALNPARNPASAILPKVIGEAAFAEEDLAAYRVVVLANVAHPGRAEALEAFVRAGGGLLVAAGENVDPDGYNEAYRRLLPRPLRAAARFGERGTEAGAARAERIASLEPASPFAGLFTGVQREQLFRAPFYAAILADAERPGEEGAAEARTVARLGGGAPLVLMRALGEGRTAFYASTLDRAWSDFPIRSSFLPFMHLLVETLAGGAGPPTQRETEIGAPATLGAAGAPREARVMTPEGRTKAVRLEAAEGGVSARFADTEAPGLYRWESRAADGAWRAEGAFAVNPAPEVGDLRPVDVGALASPPGAGAEGLQAAAAAAPGRKPTPLWPWLAAAGGLLLLGEGGLGAWMGRRRA